MALGNMSCVFNGYAYGWEICIPAPNNMSLGSPQKGGRGMASIVEGAGIKAILDTL